MTTVPITITASTTAAQLQQSSTINMAAFLGVPLLALLGWIGSRKSSRKNFFRFIGLILLVVGVSYVTGCGGSFKGATNLPPISPPVGTYLVQVVATDNSGSPYLAVVPVVVSSN
jgi:hypothetical protein